MERERLIRGIIAKWDSEKRWHDRDGLDVPSPLIVTGTTRAIQRFRDKQVIDTITTQPLPDPDDLNAAIPREEWEPDLNGEPRPPYALFYVVYLFDPRDGSDFTFLNSTAGAAIAVERLESRIRNTLLLRGPVYPIVKLSEAPFKTRYGLKSRPEFAIDGWHSPGGGPAVPAPQPTPLIAGGQSAAPEQSTASKPKPAVAERPAMFEPEEKIDKSAAARQATAPQPRPRNIDSYIDVKTGKAKPVTDLPQDEIPF
jgi:hypothetical protein